MPVFVTGAEDGLGARVVDEVRASGGEVRAYLDATAAGEREASALRSQGCKVALGELDDEGHLEAAMAQVHTVAHCWGGPLRDLGQQVEAAGTLASALLGAGVRRLVWVRELADDRANPYLATLAEIGDLFEHLPVETIMLATALRYGDADLLTARLAGGWLTGSGADPTAEHAPIHLDDVARAVAVADRQRGGARELHVRMGLLGPERMPLGEVLRRIGAPRLEAPPPPARERPPSWLVDWISRPGEPSDSTLVATTVSGSERLVSSPSRRPAVRGGAMS